MSRILYEQRWKNSRELHGDYWKLVRDEGSVQFSVSQLFDASGEDDEVDYSALSFTAESFTRFAQEFLATGQAAVKENDNYLSFKLEGKEAIIIGWSRRPGSTACHLWSDTPVQPFLELLGKEFGIPVQ